MIPPIRIETLRRNDASSFLLNFKTLRKFWMPPSALVSRPTGGDLQCVSYKDNVLVIQYQGACGSCPSSQSGTLQAIQGILRAEYNPKIEVLASQAEMF